MREMLTANKFLHPLPCFKKKLRPYHRFNDVKKHFLIRDCLVRNDEIIIRSTWFAAINALLILKLRKFVTFYLQLIKKKIIACSKI